MTEEKKPRAKAKAPDVVETQATVMTEQLNEMIVREQIATEQARRALRIDFAKAALTGLLAHHGNPNMRDLARASWQYADFMLDSENDSTR